MARAVLAMTARDQNKRLKSPGLFVINKKPSYTLGMFLIFLSIFITVFSNIVMVYIIEH